MGGSGSKPDEETPVPPERSEAAFRSKFISILRAYNCSALLEPGCEFLPEDALPSYSEAVRGVKKWSNESVPVAAYRAVQIQLAAYRLQIRYGGYDLKTDGWRHARSSHPEDWVDIEAAWALLPHSTTLSDPEGSRAQLVEEAQAAYVQLFLEHDATYGPARWRDAGPEPRAAPIWSMRVELDDARDRCYEFTWGSRVRVPAAARAAHGNPWFDLADPRAILRHFDADRPDRRLITLITGLRSAKGHPLHSWSNQVGSNVLALVAELVAKQRIAVVERAVAAAKEAERSYIDAEVQFSHRLQVIEDQKRPYVVCKMLGDVNGRSGFDLVGSLRWDGGTRLATK